MSVADRVRLREVKTLSDDHYVLRKAHYDWRRDDGQWQAQARECYDRGDGVTILLYHPQRRTVILTRQFRYPAYANGHDDLLIETPAGLLDGASPEDRIRAEAEEEVGIRVRQLHKVFEAFMSPGAVTEIVHCFVGEYDDSSRIDNAGGGLAEEGEDIEVLELPFEEALRMVEDGRIRDGKTIMLLQYAALRLFS